MLDVGPHAPVGDERVGAIEKQRGAIGLTGMPCGGRRRDQPASLRGRVDAERRRPLQRRRRRSVRTPAPCPNSRALELLGGVGVRTDRRSRQMPRPFVQSQIVVERVGQSAVGGPARARGHLLEDRRPHQRMAHLDPRIAHGHESGLLGELERLGAQPGRLRGPHHRRQPSAPLGRDQREHLLRRVREPSHALAEHPLHVRRGRKVLGQPFDTGELRGRQSVRKLDERKRIPARSLHEQVADRRRDATVDGISDQRGRRIRVEPANLKLRNLARLKATIAAIARGEQDHDPLGTEPTGDEHERIGRRSIEPLRIVHEAQHRTSLGKL